MRGARIDRKLRFISAAIQRAYINSVSSSSGSTVPIVKIAGGIFFRSAYSGETSGSRGSTPFGR